MKKNNSIKFLSVFLTLCILVSALAGCNNSAENESEGSATGSTATSSAATSSVADNSASSTADSSAAATSSQAASNNVEQLIIGTTAGNSTFSAVSQADAFGRMNYNCFTQGNFVYRDENNELQPYFFQSFEISEDGYSITFTIPLTAVWHDGEPVTADDILFTFEFMRDTRNVGSLQNLESINQLSVDSFELIFSEPDAYYWINSSVMNNSCVFAKHIWENIEDPDTYTGEDAAIGCGPYKLVSHDEDAQSSYYEAVPENNYAGDITVNSVTLQTYSGEDTLMMAMENGEIDAMFNYSNPIDATIIDTIDTENIDIGESVYSGNYQMTYGMVRSPCQDSLEFRKAVRSALDYNQLATTINGDYGTAPGAGVIPSTTKGYDSSLPILEQDLDEANALLDEAGYLDADGDGWRDYPDGSEMDLLVMAQYSSAPDLITRTADVVMSSLEKVGIKTTFDEASMASSEVWEANATAGQYDLFIGVTTAGMSYYSSAFRYFLADAKEGEDSAWLWGTYHNDEFFNALYSMMGAVSDEEYIENIQKLQNMAAEEVFAQALCWETAFFPYRTDKYTGWSYYPSWGVINARTWHELTNI